MLHNNTQIGDVMWCNMFQIKGASSHSVTNVIETYAVLS